MPVQESRSPDNRKRRRSVVVALALIAVGVLVAVSLAGRRQSTGWRPLEAFGFSFKEVAPVFPPLTPKWRTMQFQISAVSQDRRWVFLSQPGTIGGGWLFDLANRKFVGQLSPSPNANGPWDIAHIAVVIGDSHTSVVEDRVGRFLCRITRGLYVPITKRYSIYCANIPTRRAKRLAEDADRAPYYRKGNGIAPALHLQRVAYPLTSKGDLMYAARDCRTAKRRILRQDSISNQPNAGFGIWGWLPDNRTLVLCEITRNTSGPTSFCYLPLESIHLWDTTRDQPPHKISISEALERLRLEERLQPDEQTILHGIPLAVIDNGRRLRLFITFFCDARWDDPTADRSSIWDLDLKTGNLTRVMNLAIAPAYSGSILSSPSGTTFITTLPPDVPDTDTQPRPTELVVHNPGATPRILPFKIPLSGNGPRAGRHYRHLDDRIRFRNDDTLIYAQPGFELWQFDLRTWKSELLWRPNAARAAAKDEK